MIEETVGFDEKTAAFVNATNYVKRQRRKFLKDVVAAIGMNEETNSMIRAKRRKVTNDEIESLIKTYPETDSFFNFIKENEASYENQTLNEPMGTHFYAKNQIEPWRELAEVQKKMLEKQEAEIAVLKDQVRVLEMEKKVLTNTIEGILSNNK